MEELLLTLTQTNAKREAAALENQRKAKKDDAMRKSERKECLSGGQRRLAFKSQVCTVGAEFHPVLRLKPKVLDSWTAQRCVMPTRSFTVGKVPLRMQYTPALFPQAAVDANCVGPDFLHFSKVHEEQRIRHLYPILFSGTEIRPPSKAEVSLDPFRNAVSQVSRDIQLVYPYQALSERKMLMRGKATIA